MSVPAFDEGAAGAAETRRDAHLIIGGDATRTRVASSPYIAQVSRRLRASGRSNTTGRDAVRFGRNGRAPFAHGFVPSGAELLAHRLVDPEFRQDLLIVLA
mgnify:CR=1 FL=1